MKSSLYSNIYSYVIAFLAFLPMQLMPALTKAELQDIIKKLEIDIPIRVRLEEKLTGTQFQWNVKSAHGFVVYSPGFKQRTLFYAPQITVTHHKSFVINGTSIPGEHLFLIPIKGCVTYRGNNYDGVLAITQYADSVFLVNHIDLEEYVLSVLPYESIIGWPDEVQKASCIVFRTYGIAKVLEQRAIYEKKGMSLPYDIKNTTVHQLYKGKHKANVFKKIVDETRGIVVAHRQKPIVAMFDVCCGGIIPARKRGINFHKAPYLERTYPCNFCKGYKFYRWDKELSFDELEKAIKKEIPKLGMLKDIKVSEQDDSGIVRELKIRGSNQWYTIGSVKFKNACELKSCRFSLQRNGRLLTIAGAGYGHCVGFCQQGAYGMVLQGWNHRNVLKFYYPHTSLMKLKKIKYERYP